jgi:hypothetical protein
MCLKIFYKTFRKERLCERSSFFKENLFYNGKFLDTAIYSLINPAEKV